ncbi:shikimate kinase [Tritonibacter mobilis]|uniref:shikimate kinase n=1 Tax=Tritonibacter mobilis TaxID=379347 RepID=UPI0001B8A637|nr:shikimate kinase [Tritonibacter mobilis]EEW59896.1 shikimate kinase [Ruegeria sp. TrichCH4B]MCK5501325.1 shikimate kinase [Tritonibacter mobilis]SDW83407.1 shikimate kinase [Tritonibacter mobilis]
MSENHQITDATAESCAPGKLKKTIVLVGMMGAGKTAVGRALAARLDVPFLDSDHEIEAAANMSIPEIFARDGEPFFREKEHQVITRLLKEECGVLSTGGGAFLAERNRTVMSEAGVSVCLQADLDVLWKRVKGRDTRPLLRSPDPYKSLSDLYHARVPIYAQADLKVISDGQVSIDNMVDRVLEALRARPDVLEFN